MAGFLGMKRAPEEEQAREAERRLIHFKFEPMVSVYESVTSLAC
jgi:hypothetical protein